MKRLSKQVNNALICNPGKTEIVYFSSRFTKSEELLDIKVNETVVQSVNSARYLGVVLDRKTTFVNQHCSPNGTSVEYVNILINIY